MGLEQLHLEGMDKVQFSIALIQAHEPQDGYYLAFSGGKDSCALYELARQAGVKFDAHYSPSPIDPPELIRFIRQQYPAVIFDKPHVPFWKAAQRHGFPLRIKRWCCEYIKESGGAGRTVLLGLRSEESLSRRHRCFVSYGEKGRTRFDRKTTKNIISPMLLWNTSDVWTFLERSKVPYCSLYDEGASGPYKGNGHHRRLGCVLCPFANVQQRQYEMKRWPKIAEAWRLAGARYYATHANPQSRWDNADDFFEWWLSDKPAPPKREDGSGP